MQETSTIIYPRRRVVRTALRLFGRFAMRLLTRPTILGQENLPRTGPAILVGNHVAMLEAVMMVVYVPWIIELIAAGEIPLDPRYASLVHTYGTIPIRRGEMDRKAMTAALSVLKQGGVVGMFPEGGIWESTFKRARTGVAWLSYHAAAPVIPIGFGGIDGALDAAFKFKRPRISMNIGQAIPPIRLHGNNKALKAALEEGANHIMAQIAALVPEEDKQRWNRIRDERFELQLIAARPDGQAVTIPPELQIAQPDMLSKFFHRPLLLDVLGRNLRLPVSALQNLDTERDPKRLADAVQVALNYLDHDNPQFLSYRFGYEQGAAMKEGLLRLRDLARWAELQGLQLQIVPIRRYRKRGSDEEIVEDRPGGLPAL